MVEQQRNVKKRRNTWEIIAVFIGFISTARDFPRLVNFLLYFEDYDEHLSDAFCRWWMFAYATVVIVIGSHMLTRFSLTGISQKEADESEALKIYKRIKWINFWRFFPLSLIRDLVLKIYGVIIYNIFERPDDWLPDEDFFDQLMRFNLKKQTVQFEFKRDFSQLRVRTTKPDNFNFNEPEFKSWLDTPHKFLTLTSWFGLFWTLVHCVRYRKKI